MPQASLRLLLAVADLDERDMQYVGQQAARVPSNQCERAEQLAMAPRFRDFVSTLDSTMLLVHGDFEGTNYVSALSLFCLTLMRTLTSMDKFRPLIFFCGCELNDEDGSASSFSGGQAIIWSLIVQLLRQDTFDTRVLHKEVDLNRIQDGDLEELCELFMWLVCLLPENMTLFCIIDGIKYYERPEYAESTGLVLSCLLELTRNSTLRGVFKILITSPSPTTIVRRHEAFDGGGNIISMASLPRSSLGPSHLRLARQLGESIGEQDPPGYTGSRQLQSD